MNGRRKFFEKLNPVSLGSILAPKEDLTMSVKTSISITDQQDAFARKLVEDGHYESFSDVVRHGLELVRQETEWADEDADALKTLLIERMDGEFITMEESNRRIDAMIAKKRAELGL